jgi:DNA-binding GntR family transcriptional regulator
MKPSVKTKVEKTTPLPLYQKAQAELIDGIKSGRLKPHEALPSERALAEQANISRMTARKALDSLEQEGYAYRQGRKGRFVAEQRLSHDISSTLSFTTKALRESIDLSIEILSKGSEQANSKVASILRISEGDLVYTYHRLFRVAGQAILIETETVVAERFPSLLEHDLQQSTTALFEKEYGVQSSQGQLTVKCVAISAENQAYFGSGSTPYGMEVELIINDVSLTPFCYGQQIWCSEMAEFTVLTQPA